MVVSGSGNRAPTQLLLVDEGKILPSDRTKQSKQRRATARRKRGEPSCKTKELLGQQGTTMTGKAVPPRTAKEPKRNSSTAEERTL
ncbi:hypothetical protein IFM89_030467 [Coptis chinensis]|uniref:Uncharacterized protein n=1 Tax=Coptis chinensis TaxID=261450 RepID=A0A835LG72_9MAGN|nr:hypothetical protein IFM89_030467 [Coptis chinensis]